MTNRSGRTFLSLTLLGLAACNFNGGPGQQGELGNDRFFYSCRVQSDSICDDTSLETDPLYDIPVIAQGAVFGLDTDGITTEARSANGRLREERSDADGEYAFTALEAGWTAVLSRTYDGAYVDIIHIRVVPAASARLYSRTTSGASWDEAGASIDVGAGDDLELRIVPFDDKGEQLAGGLPIEWSAMPDDVVSISPKAGDNVVRVEALRSGAVTLTAKLGDVTSTISLDVAGAGGGGGGGGGMGGAGGAGGGQ